MKGLKLDVCIGNVVDMNLDRTNSGVLATLRDH